MNNVTEHIYIISTSETLTAAVPKINEPVVSIEGNADFSTVCRTCATVTEFVIPIFDGEGLQNNLADKIHRHLPILVSERDELPLVVCYQCASTLLAWHELVQCCMQADAALKARLKPDAAAEPAEFKLDNTNSEQEQQPKLDDGPPGKLDIEIQILTEESEACTSVDLDKPRMTLTKDGKRYTTCEACNKTVLLKSWKRHARSHRGERRHSCHTCGLCFSDAGNLARHERAAHDRRRPHACRLCDKAFTRKSHLQDHLRSHSDSREFVCDVCGKGSKSSAALRMHRKIHEARKFSCVECGAGFKRKSELRAHVTVHTGERAHACRCGRAFRLRGQLTAHQRAHAAERAGAGAAAYAATFKEITDFVEGAAPPPTYAAPMHPAPATPPALDKRPAPLEPPAPASPPPGARSCLYCARQLPASAYRDHLLAAHSEYLFHCDECGSYIDRKEFVLHMSMHAAEYAAKQDDKPEQQQRQQPVRKTKKNKKIDKNENDDRNKSSRRTNRGRPQSDGRDSPSAGSGREVNEFSDHSDSEDGFGPLPESVFEAIEDSQDGQPARAPGERGAATTSDEAESAPPPPPPLPPGPDEKTGSEKKSRTCPICGKVYTASSSYFYHMKHFHGARREHACGACGKRFGTRSALAAHEPVHTGTRAFGCERCGKRFRSKASLYIHAQTHGAAKRWACASCGRAFRWRAQLARHAARHGAERAHACATCARGFSVRADLLRHARTHARGDHACPQCGLRFAQRRYLKVHVDRKHPPAPAPTSAPASAPALTPAPAPTESRPAPADGV